MRTDVMAQWQVARDTFRLRFRATPAISGFVPGQFLMVRFTDRDDPLIGRPFAIYDVGQDSGQGPYIDIVYAVHGRWTRAMSVCRPGQWLDVWGPLGNGFAPTTARRLLMVAGGIGHTPFLSLAREALQRQVDSQTSREDASNARVVLAYGARTADSVSLVDEFRSLGVEVYVATDDGTLGFRGRVTDLLESQFPQLDPDTWHVACCGPEPMMKGVAAWSARHRVSAEVSLETPMACGLGICFSCVAPVVDPRGEVDYRRTCVEGPVFDARSIAWDGMTS